MIFSADIMLDCLYCDTFRKLCEVRIYPRSREEGGGRREEGGGISQPCQYHHIFTVLHMYIQGKYMPTNGPVSCHYWRASLGKSSGKFWFSKYWNTISFSFHLAAFWTGCFTCDTLEYEERMWSSRSGRNGPLSLVQLLCYCVLIGRVLHSDEIFSWCCYTSSHRLFRTSSRQPKPPYDLQGATENISSLRSSGPIRVQ